MTLESPINTGKYKISHQDTKAQRRRTNLLLVASWLLAPKRHGALTRSGFSLREPVRVRGVALSGRKYEVFLKNL